MVNWLNKIHLDEPKNLKKILDAPFAARNYTELLKESQNHYIVLNPLYNVAGYSF